MAWQLHCLFKHHAGRQHSYARKLYFLMLFLAFATTCIAVLESAGFRAAHELSWCSNSTSTLEASWAWVVEPINFTSQLSLSWLLLVLAVLPLITAIVQSVFSRFNPLAKYAALEMAALRVRTEICTRSASD